MKKEKRNSMVLIGSGVLVGIAILLSALAWGVSDSGLSFIQRHFLSSHGGLRWHPLSLTYTDDWIVETISRADDGVILVHGFWGSSKTVSPGSALLGLKRRGTAQHVSFLMSPASVERAKAGNYSECLQNGKCRVEQVFLGLKSPAVVVPVDGGEWIVLERFATSILLVNPGHADLDGIRLEPMLPVTRP